MRQLLETFRATDPSGRQYEVLVYLESQAVAGGSELVGTAVARVAGTRLELPAVRVSTDRYQLTPGGLELTRLGDAETEVG
jgi:hypothetical protein